MNFNLLDSFLYATMAVALVYSFVLLSVSIFLVHGQELFQEELTLRPHRDGTVLGHFAFTTLLKGATPREPEPAHTEDDCACFGCLPRCHC